MLIEFSISNFRSFREKQTFSMVAAPRLRKRGNAFHPIVEGEKLPALLKTAVIYGSNASGKSNLIKALDLTRVVACRVPNVQNPPLPVTPFRFDSQLIDQPSRVELNFIYSGLRYEFKLALTSERIIEEKLTCFPKGKKNMLYHRYHENTGDKYEYGTSLEGGDDLHRLWEKSTSPQILFITQAVSNSSESLNQLRLPLEWLREGIMYVPSKIDNWANGSRDLVESNPDYIKDISLFLQDLDIPVTNIRFDKYNHDGSGGLLNARRSKAILTHTTALGEVEFDFQEESDGTKNLFGFWLPWSVHANAIERILVVDELDSSLHPEIVASLVEIHTKASDPSQLIFTTHDTHLMDTKLLRRDQFWITERDSNGATQLRSIHDFEGREGEDLEKRYYEGRYRGLPFIRKG